MPVKERGWRLNRWDRDTSTAQRGGVKGGNKTVLITYPLKGREVLLKSRMRENLKSCSVRGLIAASGRRWL
jgi:hypothetical protein